MKIVGRTSIIQNLKSLDVLYNRTNSPKKALFYSKLAILELCGWIEETMDRIIKSCATRNLKDLSNRNIIEEKVIRKTYGFDYNNNFRRMLVQVIGLRGVEQLENGIDATKFHILKSTLGTLKTYRDEEAHTHIIGKTRKLDAPSKTIQNFIQVYEGLKEIDRDLRANGY